MTPALVAAKLLAAPPFAMFAMVVPNPARARTFTTEVARLLRPVTADLIVVDLSRRIVKMPNGALLFVIVCDDSVQGFNVTEIWRDECAA